MATILLITVTIIVPTASAASAHACCRQSATEMMGVSDHASDLGAKMSQHTQMQNGDCDAVCCSGVMALRPAEIKIVIANDWDGAPQLYTGVSYFSSAQSGHLTPPPRLI